MDRMLTLIEQLQSPNKDRRYEACEHLRDAPSLPDAALKALRQATHDPDPEVAQAAIHALAVQMAPPTQVSPAAPRIEPSERDINLACVAAVVCYTVVFLVRNQADSAFSAGPACFAWLMGALICWVLAGAFASITAQSVNQPLVRTLLTAVLASIAASLIAMLLVSLGPEPWTEGY